jgi:hypothetical protein
MKHLMSATTSLFASCLIVACQPAETDDVTLPESLEVDVASIDAVDVKNGVVQLRLLDPVAEPRACIVPIRVENGLTADVNVTMIGFAVTGPGEDTKGNMFAPVAAAGDTSEARVILEGQSCDAFDTLTIPEVLCKADGDNCAAKVEYIDGDALRFSQAG